MSKSKFPYDTVSFADAAGEEDKAAKSFSKRSAKKVGMTNLVEGGSPWKREGKKDWKSSTGAPAVPPVAPEAPPVAEAPTPKPKEKDDSTKFVDAPVPKQDEKADKKPVKQAEQPPRALGFVKGHEVRHTVPETKMPKSVDSAKSKPVDANKTAAAPAPEEKAPKPVGFIKAEPSDNSGRASWDKNKVTTAPNGFVTPAPVAKPSTATVQHETIAAAEAPAPKVETPEKAHEAKHAAKFSTQKDQPGKVERPATVRRKELKQAREEKRRVKEEAWRAQGAAAKHETAHKLPAEPEKTEAAKPAAVEKAAPGLDDAFNVTAPKAESAKKETTAKPSGKPPAPEGAAAKPPVPTAPSPEKQGSSETVGGGKEKRLSQETHIVGTLKLDVEGGTARLDATSSRTK